MEKKKYVLKPGAKAILLLLPEIIIILELISINSKLNKLIEVEKTPSVMVEMRCDHE